MTGKLLAAFLLCGLVATATGTSVKKLTLDDVVRHADLIFVGTAAEKTSRKDADDEHFPIWTDVRFDRLTVLKGGARPSYTVAMAGGRVGKKALFVTGMPEFEVGRRYVVCVRATKKGPCPFIGWGQGVFRVVDETDRTEPFLEDAEGVPLKEVRGGRILRVREDEDEGTRLGLSRFTEDLVKRHARHEAEARERRARERAAAKAGEEKR